MGEPMLMIPSVFSGVNIQLALFRSFQVNKSGGMEKWDTRNTTKP
jgi:hypothetical protein